jgi:hypothetical protein
MKMKMTHLSHSHYAISDRSAGQLARSSPGNGGRLPRIGYERYVICEGRKYVLKRTTLLCHEMPARKRRWVWTVMPSVIAPMPWRAEWAA